MKIGVVGYGNLGKAIAKLSRERKDVELLGIFSRRSVSSEYAPVYSIGELYNFKDKLDCLLLAGGSFSDLPKLSPRLAMDFNIVDSFDNHKMAKEHFENVNARALSGKHSAIVSAGWDPGLFSLFRIIGKSFFPNAAVSSFWGRGVSQGHSEAIRRIDGVKYAVEYTVPKDEEIKKAREGIVCDAKCAHVRECYVVAEEGRFSEIEEKIKAIPEYFRGYETIVNFITEEEFLKRHNKLYHGGRVIFCEKTDAESEEKFTMELSLGMTSNPELTASILLTYAKASKRLFDMCDFGAKTPLHVPPSLLFDGDLFDLI